MITHCIVCDDLKRFKRSVSEAQRIAYGLKELCKKYDRNSKTKENVREVSILKGHFHSPHMMCGGCPKVNKNEMRQHEDIIAKCIVKINDIIITGELQEQNKIALKRDALNLVRGRYPAIAQYVNKINSKKKGVVKSDIVKMNSLKYNNFVNYEWNLTLLEKNDRYLIGRGEINRELTHHGKDKVFTFKNPSIEFYPFNEWFTLSIEKTANNELNYYCNICMPSKLSDNTLSFIDLDLDLVKLPGGDWTLVDEDEFIINSKKYNYPQWLIDKTIEEKDKLITKINSKIFPFDGIIEDIVFNRRVNTLV